MNCAIVYPASTLFLYNRGISEKFWVVHTSLFFCNWCGGNHCADSEIFSKYILHLVLFNIVKVFFWSEHIVAHSLKNDHLSIPKSCNFAYIYYSYLWHLELLTKHLASLIDLRSKASVQSKLCVTLLNAMHSQKLCTWTSKGHTQLS